MSCHHVDDEGWLIRADTVLGLLLLATAGWRLLVGDPMSAAVLAAVGCVLIVPWLRHGGNLLYHDRQRIQRCPTCDYLLSFNLPADTVRCDSCGTSHCIRGSDLVPHQWRGS